MMDQNNDNSLIIKTFDKNKIGFNNIIYGNLTPKPQLDNYEYSFATKLLNLNPNNVKYSPDSIKITKNLPYNSKSTKNFIYDDSILSKPEIIYVNSNQKKNINDSLKNIREYNLSDDYINDEEQLKNIGMELKKTLLRIKTKTVSLDNYEDNESQNTNNKKSKKRNSKKRSLKKISFDYSPCSLFSQKANQESDSCTSSNFSNRSSLALYKENKKNFRVKTKNSKSDSIKNNQDIDNKKIYIREFSNNESLPSSTKRENSNKSISNKLNTSKDNTIQNISYNKKKFKFRVLYRRNVVYDSLDDEEELYEDCVDIEFYISPKSKFILFLDMLIFLSTLYILIYIPIYLARYEYSYINIQFKFNSTFNDYLNLLFDIIFIIDLVVNFYRAYYNFEEQLISKRSIIIINYLKNWFFLDFISSIPYYSIFIFLLKYYHNNNIVLIFHFLKLIKIIKIVKIFNGKNNKFFNKLYKLLTNTEFMENHCSIFLSIFISLICLHITTNINIIIAKCSYPNWIIDINMMDKNYGKLYISSLYFLISTMTTVGYGDIIAKSNLEIIFQILLLLIGIVAYSWLISYISNAVKEKNKKYEEFEKKIKILDDINKNYSNMNNKLYSNIHSFLEYQYNNKTTNLNSFINSLPDTIKNILIYEMHKSIIENMIFFKQFKNSDFINRVVVKLIPLQGKKNEIIINQGELFDGIFFIKEGKIGFEIPFDLNNVEYSLEKFINTMFISLEENKIINENKKNKQKNLAKTFLKKNMNDVFKEFTYIEENQKQLNSTDLTYKNKFKLSNLSSSNEHSTLSDKENKLQKKINDNNLKKINDKNINPIKEMHYLKIFDYHKNEHFGNLLMFLNQCSPANFRIKSNKADLLLLPKINAFEISVRYPNIWERLNKKSLHNLKQFIKISKKVVANYLEIKGYKNEKQKMNNWISELSLSDKNISDKIESDKNIIKKKVKNYKKIKKSNTFNKIKNYDENSDIKLSIYNSSHGSNIQDIFQNSKSKKSTKINIPYATLSKFQPQFKNQSYASFAPNQNINESTFHYNNLPYIISNQYLNNNSSYFSDIVNNEIYSNESYVVDTTNLKSDKTLNNIINEKDIKTSSKNVINISNNIYKIINNYGGKINVDNNKIISQEIKISINKKNNIKKYDVSKFNIVSNNSLEINSIYDNMNILSHGYIIKNKQFKESIKLLIYNECESILKKNKINKLNDNKKYTRNISDDHRLYSTRNSLILNEGSFKNNYIFEKKNKLSGAFKETKNKGIMNRISQNILQTYKNINSPECYIDELFSNIINEPKKKSSNNINEETIRKIPSSPHKIISPIYEHNLKLNKNVNK